MKELKILFHKDLILLFSGFPSPKSLRGDRRKTMQTVGKFLLFLLLVGYAVLFMAVILKTSDLYFQAGLGDLFLAQGIYLFLMITVFFGIIPTASSLYMSRDVSILMRLPVQPRNVLLSKMTVSTLSMMLFGLIVALPIGIKYGILVHAGILYYPALIIGLITICSITMSLIHLIIIGIMFYLNRFSRIKTVLQGIFLAAVMVASFAVQYLLNGGGADGGLTGTRIMHMGQTLSDVLSTPFPQGMLLIHGLTSGSIGTLLLSLVILIMIATFLMISVSVFMARPLYHGVANENVVGTKRTKLSKSEVSGRSAAMEIMRKDFLDILRTPVYFLNVIGIGIFLPIILMIPAVSSGGLKRASVVIDLSALLSPLQQLGIGLAAGMVIAVFLGSMAQGAIHSITREGKYIWIMQVLPISAKSQVNGRLLSSVSIQAVSLLPLSLVLLSIGFPVPISVAYVFSLIIWAVFLSLLGLYLGILHPKFNWDNPQKALKQNLMVMVFQLGSMVVIGLLAFLTYKIADYAGSLDAVFYVMSVLLVLTLPADILLYRSCIRAWSRHLPTYSAD